MSDFYYYQLGKFLEKIKEGIDAFATLKGVRKIYRKLKKKLPDLQLIVGKNEFISEWVNKNWTHTTHKEGGCSSMKLRGYILLEGIKVYSTYIAHLGYTEHPEYKDSYFVDSSNMKEIIENMGERIREPVEKAIKKYEEWYNDGEKHLSW